MRLRRAFPSAILVLDKTLSWRLIDRDCGAFSASSAATGCVCVNGGAFTNEAFLCDACEKEGESAAMEEYRFVDDKLYGWLPFMAAMEELQRLPTFTNVKKKRGRGKKRTSRRTYGKETKGEKSRGKTAIAEQKITKKSEVEEKGTTCKVLYICIFVS